MNRECGMDQEIDQRPNRVEEDRGGFNVGAEKQINNNPYTWVISSLETDLKEAEVIKTSSMDEVAGIKT